jgi:hypothetical protein
MHTKLHIYVLKYSLLIMWKIASNRFQIVESVENNLFDKWTTVFAGHKAAL